MRGALLAVLIAGSLIAPVAAHSAAPTPYWRTIDNCAHHHRSQVAKHKIVRLMHAPYVNRAAVRHLNRCVATRAKRRYLTGVVKDGWEWRGAHRWTLLLSREDAGWQAWARSTAWCESRMNQRAVSSNGLYFSYFQWAIGVGDSPDTWGTAGGVGDPRDVPYDHQAVLAINFAQAHGKQHWPVCG